MLLHQPDLAGPPLPTGSRIAVIAPSGVVQPARLERGLAVLREWGYEPIVGEHVLAVAGHTAGTEAQRLSDLRWAMTQPGIDAIWFARGGFGAMHLLDQLVGLTRDPAAVPDRLLLGFSDATAFLAALHREGALRTEPERPEPERTATGSPTPGTSPSRLRGIHAPVVTALGDMTGPAALAALRALLQEGRGFQARVDHVGGARRTVRGPLVGGNLAILASLVGTSHALRTQGAIVVLEDVGEPVYRLDRMITQLKLSGGLLGVRAFALGSFCAAAGEPDPHAQTFVEQRLAEFGAPVVVGVPVGHDLDNEPWVYGQVAELRMSEADVLPSDDDPLARRVPHDEDLAAQDGR